MTTPFHPFKAVLTGKKSLPDDVFLFTFHIVDSSLSFLPGQYVALDVPQTPRLVKRLYSIASSNKSTSGFDLLIKCVPGGIASTYVSSFVLGQTVSFAGPAGLFIYQQTPTSKIFLTTGTGFAPIRSILSSLSPDDHTKKTLLWGMPTAKSVYFFDELLAFEKNLLSFSFRLCLSREPDLAIIPAQFRHYFRMGRIDRTLSEATGTENETHEYYFCGSRDVVESLHTLLISQKIEPALLHFEKY